LANCTIAAWWPGLAADRAQRTMCDTWPLFLALSLITGLGHADPVEWTHTEGAPGGGRFSPLTEITRDNVARLRTAWTYQHGDFWKGGLVFHAGTRVPIMRVTTPTRAAS
jgi:glucose dehydrogenase